MQLSFDATRFGFGLDEAVALAASKNIPAIDFSFEPFDTTGKSATALSAGEKEYLQSIKKQCEQSGVTVACLHLNYGFDPCDKKSVKHFQQMIKKLGKVAKAIGCEKISFHLRAHDDEALLESAEQALNPLIEELQKQGVKLLLSLTTPAQHRGQTLRKWRPLQPQEWRDLIAGCPGLGLSFSAADCAWQSIDYLQILPGFVAAIEHFEANDVEINRSMLSDSGLFGPLWWRYRRPGKGQIDWKQLIEALKLYDYKGTLSIRLDDEFVDDNQAELEESLDAGISLLKPLLRY